MRNSFFKTVFVGLLTVGMIFCEVSAADNPATGVTIEKITIGEERIDTGKNQLIEVLVKNTSYQTISGYLKLSLVLPNHNIVSFGNNFVSLIPRSETRVLFPYPIEKSRGGDYTVGAKMYSTNGKVLAQNSDADKKYFFAVDPSRRNEKPKRPFEKTEAAKKAEKEKSEKAIMQTLALFEPPDPTIEEISFVNNDSILRGETAYIRLIFSNLGGDIAQSVTYSVSWFFAPRENRKVKAFNDTLKVLAPGERKIVDVPVTIPEIEQKGEYFITASLDENNQIKELNEANNSITSTKTIIFSDIALVYPDDMHSFAEEGLFRFQWRSKKYNQFKVQISADKLFANVQELFELPKGEEAEGWTPEFSIKPLTGEMPSMALALMGSNGIDYLYWRVKAKNPEGGTTESSVRQFYINLKAAPK